MVGQVGSGKTGLVMLGQVT